jgi:23S rRNA pseudouridine2605 synthase
MAAARALRQGIELEDGLMRPSEVSARSVGGRRWELELTIAEGRTREVRRACEMLDLQVERLVRIGFGPIMLGDLPPGGVRPLTSLERQRLQEAGGARTPMRERGLATGRRRAEGEGIVREQREDETP